jgi:phage terminase large subunit-like protein
VQVGKLLGWDFFPWQVEAVDVAGEYHRDTKVPVYRTVGVSVARQNGKTTLVLSRIARQLIAPRQTVAYTAQDRGLARTKWDEHVTTLMDTPFAARVARIDRTNQRECLTMANGSRYMPVTPTNRKAGRSLSIDLAVIDEAHAHDSMGVVSALAPTMAARPHAQVWLLSNAGESRSLLWKHYTDIGRMEVDNPASTMCWIEYAADPMADVFDRSAWGDANPSLGYPGGVLETALSDGALTMDRSTFLREHLNIWADSDAISGIDAVTWAACRHDELMPGADVAFGLDFTPERDRGALVVAGVVPDHPELIAVEIIEASSDLERIVTRAAEVANTWDALVIIDRGSPAASAIPALEKATARDDGTNRVRMIPLTELVRACGDFHDAAVQACLSHRGDFRLTDAVVGASKRTVGEAWAWKRRGGADISPLIAATLARWGVVAAPEPLIPAVY